MDRAVANASAAHDAREERAGWRLAAPSAVLIVVLLILPTLAMLGLSLTDLDLGDPNWHFNGLQNYVDLASDRTFRISIANTAFYVVIVTPVSVLLGLGAAMLIEAGNDLKGVFRSAYFLPVVSLIVAMATVWQYIWQATGFAMVLFLAGLTAIDPQLYHAAEIDGAKSWVDRFRLVTWPILAPTTLFVTTITMINAVKVFETVMSLTQGGPSKASEVLLWTIYEEGFIYLHLGNASAMAVIFVAVLLVLIVLQTRVLDKRVHYG
jgi:multiple sugar transport system permease protein